MPTVVGVRFKPVTKVYYFLPPKNDALAVGDPVIVETSRGQELGWIAAESKRIPQKEVKGQLKKVVRRATPPDLVSRNDYEKRKASALAKCREKVEELGLPMKVIDAEYAFDGSRILFSFSAEQRVDFRDLVRVLVRSLRTRVEIRQVGARDEAKIVDGYGRCGRQLCCSSWLTEFHPVSIKMAKNQQLPLAPTEISGVCGRLLCCLAYEDSMYTELRKSMPKPGRTVQTEEGIGRIKGVNILKQTVIVDFEEQNMRTELSIDDITILENRPQKRNQPAKTKTDEPQKSDKQSRRQSRQSQSDPQNIPTSGKADNQTKKAKPEQEGSSDSSSKPKRKRRRSRNRKKQNQPKTP
ncbi:MAG: stage 0 sporulation family protein [Chloroflexota bacterium]